MRIAIVLLVALMMSGCGLKTQGDLLTGSISIHDNISNSTATEVLDTTKDVNNGIERVRTLEQILRIYRR